MTVNPSGWRPEAPENDNTVRRTFANIRTATGNRALMLEEPLIFEIGSTETTGVDFTILPGTGRGTACEASGGGGSPHGHTSVESPLHQPSAELQVDRAPGTISDCRGQPDLQLPPRAGGG